MKKGAAQGKAQQLTPFQGIGLGLVLIVVGAVPVLAALGVIPSDDDAFNVPRWLVAVLAGIFPAAGLWMMLTGIAAALGPKSFMGYVLSHAARVFINVAVLAFIAALAVFFTWELFAPYPGTPPALLGRIFDRFGYAVGAILFDLILVMSLWNWAKQLLGIRESPPSSRGTPTSPR